MAGGKKMAKTGGRKKATKARTAVRKKRKQISTEGDAALVLTTAVLGLASFVTMMVILVRFLEWAPGYIVLEAVIAMVVFAAVVGKALITRANATPDKYRVNPPVLPLSLGRHRATPGAR